MTLTPVAVAVDVVLLSLKERGLSLLLIRRGIDPFKGRWALPGGFVLPDEDLAAAASRELREEAGLGPMYLRQFGAYGAPGRDPRGRVVSIAFFALVRADAQIPLAATDADAAAWFPIDALPELAFDHAAMVGDALRHVRAALDREPAPDTGSGPALCAALLPEAFTLAALQRVHEAVLGRALDKRNFRRRMLTEGVVEPALGQRHEGAHRPAQLFRFRGPVPAAVASAGRSAARRAPKKGRAR